MIGVVLWSDTEDGKAVLWCEDQGDLAYYSISENPTDDIAFFDAGDVVQFDVTVKSRLRRACNARLLKGNAHFDLPEKLRQEASTVSLASAKILPFRREEPPAKPAERPKRKA